MTPDQFIQKWSLTSLKESAAAKEHFLDLCALLQQPLRALVADPLARADNARGFAFDSQIHTNSVNSDW